jgi:hypothetical protein
MDETELDDARWRASAYFRIALAWQAKEDYARAQTYYAAAVRERPAHEPALHNLAVTQLRLARYDAARYRLEHLLDLLPWDAAGHPPELYFSATYNLALATRYAQRFEEAANRATELLRDLRYRIAGFSSTAEDQPAASAAIRREYLERLRHPTVLLVAGSLAAWWEQVEHLRWRPEEMTGPGARRYPERALRDLDAHLHQWRERPWLPLALEQTVRDKGRALSPRSRYNLACFRSMRAPHVDDLERTSAYLDPAWRDLEIALEDGHLTVWAQHDPSLAEMRQFDRFWDIVGRPRPADAPTEPGPSLMR